MKKVLSIAGSDCSGGAGIQADLKTFSAHGVFGMSVIVSVVAENTSRVIDIQDITPDMIEKQIDAVFEDIEVDAVKIGMLSTPECMKAVAKKLLQYKPQNVVIDPVMYAKNGCPLMNPTAVSTLIDTVQKWLPIDESYGGFHLDRHCNSTGRCAYSKYSRGRENSGYADFHSFRYGGCRKKNICHGL